MAAERVDDIMIVEQHAYNPDYFPADDGSGFPSDNDDGEEEKSILWSNIVQNTWLMIVGCDLI